MQISRRHLLPSANEDSRLAELENVEQWSRTNNLALNRSKSLEIIFSDKRRKHCFQQQPLISTIKRVTTIKILGVFISGTMSVTEHINNIIALKLSMRYVSSDHTACERNLPGGSTRHSIRTLILQPVTFG